MSVFSHVQIPPLSSLYFRDDRVPDIGADYSRLRGPKRFKWSPQEKKEVLYLLNDFDNPCAELQKIFHAYFAKKYSNGFKPRKAAWQSMSNHIAHEVSRGKWSHRRVFRQTRAKLASVVKSVGIQLLPKPHADPVFKSRSHRRTNLLALEGETTPSENDWSSEGSENSHEIRSQSPANLGTPRVQRVPPLRGYLHHPRRMQRSIVSGVPREREAT